MSSKVQAARLKELFYKKLRSEIKKELELSNIHEVPEIEKVVLNIGLGKAKDDKKYLEVAENTLLKITGQKPVHTVAKKSVAGFKLREGNKIGMKVTLRGDRMYEFLDRFINIVLPRLRDFHGVKSTSFDKNGTYAIGLNDQTVFPEITFEDSSIVHGLQIIINIQALKPEHSRLLLEKLGMPFEKERQHG